MPQKVNTFLTIITGTQLTQHFLILHQRIGLVMKLDALAEIEVIQLQPHQEQRSQFLMGYLERQHQ